MTPIIKKHSPKCPCEDCRNTDLISPSETEKILRKDHINDPFDEMNIFMNNQEIMIKEKIENEHNSNT